MAEFVEVPVSRLQPDVLQALLEEFTSRDGTDYGRRELPLLEKVAQLRHGLEQNALTLLYDTESEHWDLVEREQARALLCGADEGAL